MTNAIISRKNLVSVDKNVLEEYSTFVDIVSHERDKLFWNYVESDYLKELVDYLDK